MSKLSKILTLLLLLPSTLSMAQAKKPTLMVVPSDAWCKSRGYEQQFDNQGTAETIADYSAAVANDMELKMVITKINTLMAERGFPLKDLEQNVKSIARMQAEDRVLTNSKTGSAIAESPLDQIRRTAKADILLEIGWVVNEIGPKKSVTYMLRAIDAYSDKQVAGAEGTGAQSFSVEVPTLLEEAVLNNMDMFNSRLMAHFDDMMQNGREVVMDIRTFEGSEINLETEYDGYQLVEIIDNWLAENCVNHRFSKSDATESMALYEQVRIPLYRANGMAQDTYGFARELARHLGKAPYNVPVKTVNRGLGRCLIIIGEK